MQTFEVGKPFPLPFSQDGILALFTGGALHLCVVLSDPTEEETESFLRGDMKVGLFVKDNCIFVTPQFGNLVIGDCTMNGAIEPKEKLDMFVEAKPEERTGALFFLIDGNGGIVRGIRHIYYDERFTEKLQQALMEQIENPPNQHFTLTVHNVYQQYSTDDLFAVSEHYIVRHFSLSDRTTLV